MKKIKLIIFSVLAIIFCCSTVDAASFSMSSKVSSVKPNGTFTVSVGGDCIGRVNLSVSNGTLSTSSVWVEQGYVNVTVTAGGSGKVVVTATPVTGFSDSDANIYNPGARSVSVNITSNNTTPPTKPTTPDTSNKKSSDNNLSSLSVDEGELSPAFDKSKTEYNLNLPASINKIIIKGTLSDSKAKVNGLGEVTLKVGENVIDITVTAENGSKKVYTIKAYVDETPQVYLNYKNEKIGVIRNNSDMPTLEGFSNSEYKIDDNTINLFIKDALNLIYGINEKNERGFYLFNKDSKKIEYKISLLKVNDKVYLITDVDNSNDNLTLDKITINEQEVVCSKFKNGNDNYCILKVLKEDGSLKNYLYEKTEGTIQLYNDFNAGPELKKENKNILVYVLGGMLFLTISIIVFLLYKIKKGVFNEKTN